MKHSKLFFMLLLILGFATNSFAVLPYSQRMAQAQMVRSRAQISWDYPNGLFVESVLKVYDMYGGAMYYDYASNYAKATIDAKTGKISSKYDFSKFTLDNLNPAMLILEIYKKEGLPQYKIALDTLAKQLVQQPRNPEGGYWHKKVYPNQMWLDGLYMGARYGAAYEKEYNKGAYYDDVVNQFLLIHAKTYNPEFQLNYHVWSADIDDPGSFWAKRDEPFKGSSHEFWSRGIGWYAASLVEVLEVLPNDYPKRKNVLDILSQVLAGIKRWQDPKSGCWYQLTRYDSTLVVDGKANYLEASASSMFAYALLKSVRLGFVPKEEYEAVGIKAYEGIIKNFVSEDSLGVVSLNRICKSAGLGPATDKTRDGSIRYYLTGSDAGAVISNDLKGVGPFILASLEYERWQAANKVTNSTDSKTAKNKEKSKTKKTSK